MISSRKSWQEYLGSMPLNERCDPAIYATQWAHDPRCLRSGAAHRRVGQQQQSIRQLFALWVPIR